MSKAGYHWGPRIDKIPVSGWIGLLFTLGVCVMALVALPIAKWFLLASLAGGALVFAGLRLSRKS